MAAMRGQKRKNVFPVTREQIQTAWRDEIAGDVFELWIGILWQVCAGQTTPLT